MSEQNQTATPTLTRELREKNLEAEIQKTLLMEEEEKKYWLDQIKILPDVLLDQVFNSIHKRDQIVDYYIQAGLSQDKDRKYLSELKGTIQTIKTTALKMEEESQGTNAEDILGEGLKSA